MPKGGEAEGETTEKVGLVGAVYRHLFCVDLREEIRCRTREMASAMRAELTR